ncbi:hypothetical protein GCM10027395_09990 [Giesbergeria sinuosa]
MGTAATAQRADAVLPLKKRLGRHLPPHKADPDWNHPGGWDDDFMKLPGFCLCVIWDIYAKKA